MRKDCTQCTLGVIFLSENKISLCLHIMLHSRLVQKEMQAFFLVKYFLQHIGNKIAVKFFSLQRFLFQNMEHLTGFLVTFFHKTQQRHNWIVSTKSVIHSIFSLEVKFKFKSRNKHESMVYVRCYLNEEPEVTRSNEK